MKTQNSSPVSGDIEQIGREILASLYEAFLADGHIDPEGKSEEQLMAEIREGAVRWSKKRPMMCATDFRQNLLDTARTFKRRGKNHDAILYYGTWLEHWINGVLLRKVSKLDAREACQMIRDVNVRGKLTWLLALIHEKRIPQRHLKAIYQICEFRNDFVHYKYKMFDVDDAVEANRLREATRSAEKTIRYLQNFEERHFFRGSARGLLRKLRNTKNE